MATSEQLRKPLVAGFTAAYDKASNRLYERHLHNERFSHLYPADRLDSADRLREYQRGRLEPGGDPPHSVAVGTAPEDPFYLRGASRSRSYNLDRLGNWDQTTYTPSGETSSTTETRTHNDLNQVAARDGAPLSYDANGNLTDDGWFTYGYDVFDRLRRVTRQSDGKLVAESFYDAGGRRIRKVAMDLEKDPPDQQAVTPSGLSSTIQRRYDSVGRTTEERQAFGGYSRDQTTTGFESEAAVRETRPGGRQLEHTVDTLYRRTAVVEAATGEAIAERSYYGPGRTAELKLGNQIICTHLNNERTRSAVQAGVPRPAWGDRESDHLGYDGAGRLIGKRYVGGVRLEEIIIKLGAQDADAPRFAFTEQRWDAEAGEWADHPEGLSDAEMGKAVDATGGAAEGDVVALDPVRRVISAA